MKLLGTYKDFCNIDSKATSAAKTCYSVNLKNEDSFDKNLNEALFKAGHSSVYGHEYVNLKMNTSKLHTLFLYSHPFYVSDERSFRYTKPTEKTFYDFGNDSLRSFNNICLLFYKKIYSELLVILKDDVKSLYKSNYEKNLDKKAFELARMVLPLSLKTNLWHTVNAEVLYNYLSIRPAEIVCHNDFINEVKSKVILNSATLQESFSNLVPDNYTNIFKFLTNRNSFKSDITEMEVKRLDETKGNLHPLDPFSRELKMRTVSGSGSMSVSGYIQLIRHRTITTEFEFDFNSFYIDSYLAQSKYYQLFLKYVKEKLVDMRGSPFLYYMIPSGMMVNYNFRVDAYSLINLFKKRLCFNAQNEIFKFVYGLKLNLGYNSIYFYPPCCINNTRGVNPKCPEGERFCRVPVWKNPDFYLNKNSLK